MLVGRSNNVGKPAAILGLQRNATVISAHRHTFDAGRLAEHTLGADILIVAVGVPGLIGADLVREGTIVIDIGINAVEQEDGTVALVGDVDTAAVEPIAEAISPVPGGVGPITDIWVLRNTVAAAWLQTQPAGMLGRLDLTRCRRWPARTERPAATRAPGAGARRRRWRGGCACPLRRARHRGWPRRR